AEKYGIELIHDLFHYGYPERIDLFSEAFPRQFADYCFAAADYITRQMPGTYWFTPINEPSFFSWAAGEVGLFSPHAIGRGWELKVQLIKAAIRGIEAIRAACSGARIVNVDPLCHIAVPREKPELQREIDGYNQGVVFQGWDLLGGKLMPELGGSPEHLGIVGVNYYWTNQWEWGHSGQPLAADDERRWPLNRLIQQVWSRYGAEMLITETSHLGELRPIWLRELTNEVKTVLNTGLPLHGVCLYPILGMPEWHAPEEWTQMGLWELRPNGDRLERVPHSPMMEALREAQQSEEIRRLSLRPA
ncbi:MAG TPA: glycoside hydrolase, partial [Blastocatellia bacterium]|nr:glycoside hydrolase [Blastocatellia bacterium]